MSCRRPDGTGHEDNRFVVPSVAVAAGGAFDVLDSGVGFDLAGGGAGDDEGFDLIPPPADRAIELVRLRPSGGLNEGLEFLFRRGGVSQRVGAQQRPQLFLDLPDCLDLAGGVIGGEDLGQAAGRVVRKLVAGAQEQHPVGPGLVDAAAAAALDLLGEVLPGLSHGLVGQRDQVEMIDCDGGAWKPNPQGFSERRRRVDRDDLHAQAPLKRAGEEPVPDAPVVPAVDDTQDLPGVQVHDGGHPRLVPDPRAGLRVTEISHGPEPVFIDAEHARAELIHVGQGEEAGFVQRGTDHPPGHRERRGGFGHGPAGTDDRVNDVVPEPAGGAGAARHLSGGFKEREPGTLGFHAVPAVLGPEDLNGAGDRNVADPVEAPFLPPRRHHTAGRAARQPTCWLSTASGCPLP